MTRTHSFIYNWLPVLVWMSVIYLFSSQAHSGAITASYFGGLNVLVRKCAHLFEYFVLALLSERAFRRSQGALGKYHMFLALGLCALYALSDEWHQSFVPGRSACLSDALVDVAGSALALVCLLMKPRLIYLKQ